MNFINVYCMTVFGYVPKPLKRILLLRRIYIVRVTCIPTTNYKGNQNKKHHFFSFCILFQTTSFKIYACHMFGK